MFYHNFLKTTFYTFCKIIVLTYHCDIKHALKIQMTKDQLNTPRFQNPTTPLTWFEFGTSSITKCSFKIFTHSYGGVQNQTNLMEKPRTEPTQT